MKDLLERELVFVTGKGGVGKTTVALALGLAAARAGRRAIVCELAGQAHAARLFGHAPPVAGGELALTDGLWTTTIDPHRALEEWAARQVHSRRLAHTLTGSHTFAAFVAAAPGVSELGAIAKAWELGRPERWTRHARGYDVVVVDGPASGHGVGMLRTPRTFAEIARVGPIASQSRRVRELLEDPARSAMVGVTLPAELPVSETLELEGSVADALRRGLDAIVVNGVLPRRFTNDDVAHIAAADGAVAPAVLAAVRSQHGQAAAQQSQLRRLRRLATAPVHSLPFVATPALALEHVDALADRLAG